MIQKGQHQTKNLESEQNREKSGREFLSTDKKSKIYTEKYPTEWMKNDPLILGCFEFSEHQI